MISAAPTFAEVSAALAERLSRAVLVAHNLTFDSRMLVNDYRRTGWFRLTAGALAGGLSAFRYAYHAARFGQ